MRRGGFTFVEFVVVLVIIGVLASMLFPVLNGTHCYEGRRPQCQSNLKQIGLGFLQYVQDNDEKFPSARKDSNAEWAQSISSYLKRSDLFQCPSTPAVNLVATDYFYNSCLSAVKSEKIFWMDKTILAGEGEDNSPLYYALSKFPKNWRSANSSPARRHLDGSNYLFADGHVKWLEPRQVVDGRSYNKNFSFLTQ